MRRTPGFSVLALCTGCFFTNCQPSPAITVIHLAPGQRGESVQGDVVKTRRGGQEGYVGVRTGYYVVRNLDDWRNAWPSGTEPPLPATLDTSRSMLLIAIAERKEVVELQIHKVLETGEKIYVWVKETSAGQNCKSKLDHAPSDAVVAPRIDKPVQFYIEDEKADSCGDAPGVSINCRLNDTPAWLPKLAGQPGDKIECEMTTQTRGKFALVDSVLSLGEVPGGSSAKLTFAKGPSRGAFTVDVFGAYSVRAETTDEAGRKGQAVATVDALPPKTRDALVQLVWTNFDVSDDPETFPRVKLRAFDDREKTPKECSLDNPHPELCEVKKHSAYTHMKLKPSDRRIPLDVFYVDERIEKGPLVCVQVYFDGARTGEKCDRLHRDPEEKWHVGTVDMSNGKLLDAMDLADAGAGDGGADAGAAKKPAVPPKPTPKK
jgi:hypothetical protein